MKKFVFVFTLFLISFKLDAQWSELTLSTYNQIPFDLIIDGQLLAENVTSVTVTEIQPGNHSLKLVKANNTYNRPYGVFPNQQASLFKGNIQIPANQKIEALVYYKQFIIGSQTILNQQNPNGNSFGQAYNSGSNWNNTNYNYSYSSPNHYGQYGNTNNYMPGMNTHWNVPPPNCPQQHGAYYQAGPESMPSNSFNQLKNSINKQWFSDGQLKVFQQALASNYFTSAQVYELTSLFTFSSDQLTVAKQAYAKTIDPENYFIVSDALEFSSAVSELSSYIAAL